MILSRDDTAARLNNLVEIFGHVVDARGAGRTAEPMPRELAGQGLGVMVTTLSGSIYDEMNLLADLMPMTHERISLVLRYPQPIFGEDVSKAELSIRNDFVYSADAATAADQLLQKMDVLDQTVDTSAFAASLKDKLIEHTRLLNGIFASPLPPEEVAEFHAIYPIPEDPLFSFQGMSARIDDQLIRIVNASADRIESTMRYMDYMDTIMIPSFPQHESRIRAQANDMVKECYEIFDRAQTVLARVPLPKGP